MEFMTWRFSRACPSSAMNERAVSGSSDREHDGLSVVMLTACAHPEPVGPTTKSTDGPVQLNGISASRLIEAFTRARLPTANPRDVTDVKCPRANCLQAIDTDTLSVIKFPTTGLAQKYAGSMSNVYQVEDLVLVFAPAVTAGLKSDYEKVVERAVG